MAMALQPDIETRLGSAVEFARAAGRLTLDYFRRHDLAVERKSDDSPVTAADRAAEQLLRKLILDKFPHDSILGEEFGSVDGTSGFQWVLDPIDGTKSFIHGVPLYTTLIGVLRENEPQIGVINAPACGETAYAAIGGGCWHVDERRGNGAARPAHVSRVGRLCESLVLTSEMYNFTKSREVDALPLYLELQRKARLERSWGDGFGYLLVATGRAEVMLDPVMNLWDIAALFPVIEEAGGHFRDWRGERTIHSLDSLATNGLVTDEVLGILKQSG
jgi:histidinol phosphatase-like enzyme (inositol monophosphatase family)